MSLGIVVTQVGLMMALIAVGWVVARSGLVGQDSVKGMTDIVIYLATPCVAVEAFQKPYDPRLLSTIGLAFAVDVGVYLVMIGLAHVIFAGDWVGDGRRRSVVRFGVVYSNCGFMGLPLAGALLGSQGIIFMMVFVAVTNICLWTQGDAMMGGNRLGLLVGLKAALKAPALLATVLGLTLFVTSCRLPSPLSDLVAYLGDLNTPLSMLVVGASLVGTDIRSAAGDRAVWSGVVVRNLGFPLILLGLLALVPLSPAARLATAVAVACPAAALVAMLSIRHGIDPGLAVRLLCLSTLASVITLPLVVIVANLIL